MASKQPIATHPGRKRVEERNPKMVDELLQYASAHGAVVYGVHPRTIERAIERHYTEPLRLERYAEVAEANEQIERLSELCSDTEEQLALTRAELADAQEQLALMTRHALNVREEATLAYEESAELDAGMIELREEMAQLKAALCHQRLDEWTSQITSKRSSKLSDADMQYLPDELRGVAESSEDPKVAELQNALASALVALSLPSDSLYAVQAMQDLGQVHRALHEGGALATLNGQLVAVRRLHVHSKENAPVQATTVLAQGACVCTEDALLAAGLPVPAGAK